LVGFAGAGATATLIDLANEPAEIYILGEAGSDNLGTSLATGDIDGDGLMDLLAVACFSHPLGGTRTGTLYILWGDQLGQSSVLDLALNPAGVARIFGKPGDDDLACNVASGDFNRDGYDDIVWGHPLTGAQSGKAYIIFGAQAFPETLDLYAQPPDVVTIYGDVEGGTVGRNACACDVDGDDFQDIVLTAPWLDYSETFIIRGRDSFPTVFHTGVSEPGMIRIIDNIPNANMQSVACADLNGDGCDDLLLGAIQAERLVLVYGSPSLSATDSVLLASPTVPIKVVIGEYSHGALGIGVEFGDVDDNGRADLVAGTYLADPMGCYDCGEVYVLYDADALPDTVDLATTTVSMTRVMGFGSSTKYGSRVLCPDLTGDSIDDLVIANYPINVRATASFILGRKFMPSSILLATESGPITRIIEAEKGDRLGYGVTAIDVNSDGIRELMLGAQYADPPGRSNAGIIYGFFSSSLMTAVRQGHTTSFPFHNVPNPFSNETTFRFGDIPSGTIDLAIYDVSGRHVFRKTIPSHRGGALEVVWDGRDERGKEAPSGVYFCRARVGGVTVTHKMVLVR
jgi:hypothetical protein